MEAVSHLPPAKPRTLAGSVLRSRYYSPAFAAGLLGCLLCLATPGRADDQPRQRINADLGWEFVKGDPRGAEKAGFDDTGWRDVDLPHDWSIEGPYDQKAPAGGLGAFLPTGIGWYRRHFTAPESWQGRKVFVEFDGVYMDGDVWINGQHLGLRPYGYMGFQYDLTPYLNLGGTNIISVRVDNSHQPNSRWYSGSGIYRHAWFNITAPIHVEHWGTYVTTPRITGSSATVQIRTRIENENPDGQSVTLISEVLDTQGRVVATNELKRSVGKSAVREFDQQLEVAAPELWSLDSPTLYRVHGIVKVGGQVVDQYETPFGIRQLQYDTDRGFLLNGKHVKVLGMCVHQDGGAMGAAVPIEVWERRLTLLKAMGCNAIRCAHCPPSPEFLDLCDRLGFLVMDEAFDEWTVAKGGLHGSSYSTLFNEWSEKDLTDMLLRDRNHPCVILWSIGNEIPQQTSQLGVEIARKLTAICHAVDPTRPVTSACDSVHDPNPTWPSFIAALDIAGYNYVDRWGIHREIYFSDDREKYPHRKFIGTEDAGIGGVRGNYFGANAGGPGRSIPFFYASNMIRAEQLWKFNATHDYVIGYFMWTGCDYLGESRLWPRKSATSGVLDTCGFPKDGYYFYQSQWTDQPMVHILPDWNYPGAKESIIPVVVYSNCPEVELQLNGRSFGAKSLVFPRPGAVQKWNDPTPAGTTADLHLTWDVPFESGTLRAIGRRDGKVVTQEEIHTAGAPAAIALACDKAAIASSTRGVAQIEVRILDADGNLVTSASNAVNFDVQGPAKIVGVDNGDPSSHDSYQSDTRPAFHGMALAILQANKTPGRVTVTARAEGLKDATVGFDVEPGPAVPTLP